MAIAQFEGVLAAELPAPDPNSPEQRVMEAALACIARWGLAKTTLDDIAREAGCSRATVYRLFPGGKQTLIHTVGQHEVVRLLALVTAEVTDAAGLEDVIARAMHTAGKFIADNAPLAMLIRHEPEVLLPFLAFDQLGPVLELTSEFLSPHLTPYVDRTTAEETCQWAARIVLSYSFIPLDGIDLTDIDVVRTLVRQTMLPGIEVAARQAGRPVAALQVASQISQATPTAHQGALQ